MDITFLCLHFLFVIFNIYLHYFLVWSIAENTLRSILMIEFSLISYTLFAWRSKGFFFLLRPGVSLGLDVSLPGLTFLSIQCAFSKKLVKSSFINPQISFLESWFWVFSFPILVFFHRVSCHLAHTFYLRSFSLMCLFPFGF